MELVVGLLVREALTPVPQPQSLAEDDLVGIDEETQAPNEEVATLKLQAECHQTIAKYTEAQLRSVELKANVKTDFGHLRVSLSKPIPLDDPSVINGVAEEVGILDEPGDSND